MYVPDFNVQQHYQLYRRTDSQRIGEWERGSGLRSPADTHAGRSQAHHVARVCPEPPSSNDTFATRLSLSDLQRTRDERRRGGAEDEIYCLSRTLSLYPPSPGGQLPSPLTGAPLPSSLPLSLALLCYNSRNICLWICNQLVKESRKHIHTNVAAGVKLIFTDIRSVRTYSPLIWSWRKRPEHCQLILYQDSYSEPDVKTILDLLFLSILVWLYCIIKSKKLHCYYFSYFLVKHNSPKYYVPYKWSKKYPNYELWVHKW